MVLPLMGSPANPKVRPASAFKTITQILMEVHLARIYYNNYDHLILQSEKARLVIVIWENITLKPTAIQIKAEI